MNWIIFVSRTQITTFETVLNFLNWIVYCIYCLHSFSILIFSNINILLKSKKTWALWIEKSVRGGKAIITSNDLLVLSQCNKNIYLLRMERLLDPGWSYFCAVCVLLSSQGTSYEASQRKESSAASQSSVHRVSGRQ